MRVRHYTRVSGMQKIVEEQKVIARDQNKVFVERAGRKPMSPNDAEEHYQLKRGRGDAYVEFDVRDDEVKVQFNARTQLEEFYVVGDVDLTDRAAIGRYNF